MFLLQNISVISRKSDYFPWMWNSSLLVVEFVGGIFSGDFFAALSNIGLFDFPNKITHILTISYYPRLKMRNVKQRSKRSELKNSKRKRKRRKNLRNLLKNKAKVCNIISKRLSFHQPITNNLYHNSYN